MKKFSVALAVHNEEKNLDRCLTSVEWAGEIIVVDGGSTDKTVDVARQHHAKVIRADNPVMFHINKQKALNACTGDWVLQLDADEVVTPQLRDEVQTLIRKNPTESGFYIPRKNFFLGHWLHKGGQYPDYVIRLFRRDKGYFPAKSVHEQIAIEGAVGYLKNPIEHYSYRTLTEYWRKADTYTSLAADEIAQLGLSKSMSSYLQYEIIKPIETFLLLFLRHKGFLDGIYGFLFALFSALHYPIEYQKYLKIKQEKSL